MIRHILFQLDERTLLSAAAVSRLWRTIAEDTALWRKRCTLMGVHDGERVCEYLECAPPLSRSARHRLVVVVFGACARRLQGEGILHTRSTRRCELAPWTACHDRTLT